MKKLVDYIPLNFQLLANPVNWIIVFLMLALAAIGLALIFKSTDETVTAEE